MGSSEFSGVDLERFARAFAHAAHGATGQLRRYTKTPYILHPEEVVGILHRAYGVTEVQLAVGWLHDVVEDTKVTGDMVREFFGPDVAGGVLALTDVSKPEDGNRKARKAIDLANTAGIEPRWKTVKLADVISNSKTIVEHDPDFAKVWLPEKSALLGVLREGDAGLWREARIMLDRAMARPG